MRTKTYYHGTDAKDFDPTTINPVAGRFDLCLTDEIEVAQAYAEDERSGDGERNVYAITVKRYGMGLADEEEAEEIIKDLLGVDSLDMWLFEYLDDPAVMEAIVSAGFGGVEFVDQSPIDYAEHDTVRLYCADAIIEWEEA